MSTHPTTQLEVHKLKSPPIGMAIAAVVALLILTQWLHFLLSLEIESMGREIDVKTAELQRLQRENLATMRQITLLESQRRMADEAKAMGFRPQQPLYLTVERPIAPRSSRAGESAFFTIWTLGLGKAAAAAGAAEGSPDELTEPAISVAILP